jgi:beta-glucosidase
LQLLRRLRAQGVPTVAVFLSGRPLWVNRELNAAAAFVAAWLPGSEGEGIADVLFRSPGTPTYDFTGRLAFSWPATAMPVSFDSAGKVSGAVFQRGFGLDYHSATTWTALAEDPQVPARWLAPVGSLFHAAHSVAPWSIFVADAAGQVHLTTQHQDSPLGALQSTAGVEGNAIVWSGARSGTFLITGRASNLQGEAARGLALTLRYRVDQVPDAPVKLGMLCTRPLCGSPTGAMLDVSQILKSHAPGSWQTLTVPLACLAHAPARLDSVEAPLAIETSGHLGLTLSEARLAPPGARSPAPCP